MARQLRLYSDHSAGVLLQGHLDVTHLDGTLVSDPGDGENVILAI